MMCHTSGHLHKLLAAIALASALAVGGCAKEPVLVRKPDKAPYDRPVTLAVAPVVNYSGNENIDTLKVTDLLFSELQQVPGIVVVPVNRVLAQMVQDRMPTLETPEQAMALTKKVGADGIVVAAITEYNPYYPPIVGLALQLYGFDAPPVGRLAVDPVGMERAASPMQITIDPEQPQLPKNQLSRIYNSRDHEVLQEVEDFADCRGTAQSPYGWRLYLRSQEMYLRFVFHEALTELFTKERLRVGQPPLSDRKGV